MGASGSALPRSLWSRCQQQLQSSQDSAGGEFTAKFSHVTVSEIPDLADC